MKVTFALRTDAQTKPGGDSSKVPRYIAGLDTLGIKAEIALTTRELDAQRPDIVHALNLDLPFENHRALVWAKTHSVPFVLSPILHPLEGVDAFFHSGSDWFNRTFASLRASTDDAYALRELVRLARARQLHARDLRIRRRSLRQRLVERADALLPMCPSEAAELGKLSPKLLPTTIVPNGLSFDAGSSRSQGRRDRSALVLGRVEPRKNQVALLRAWKRHRLPYRLTFAGHVNGRHPGYVREFRKLIDEVPGATWVGHVDRSEVRQLLEDHEYHLGTSWFEVVSQADLEALALGNAVVTTRYGYVSDYVNGPLVTADPRALEAELPELLERAEEARGSVSVRADMQHSWPEVAEKLRHVYRSLA